MASSVLLFFFLDGPLFFPCIFGCTTLPFGCLVEFLTISRCVFLLLLLVLLPLFFLPPVLFYPFLRRPLPGITSLHLGLVMFLLGSRLLCFFLPF